MPNTPSLAPAASLVGRTVHVVRGSKYAGPWSIVAAEDIDGYPGWATIHSADRRQWNVEIADTFDTEAEARAVAASRRRPRQPSAARPLYGDFAQLAALNGLRTDGSGKRAR